MEGIYFIIPEGDHLNNVTGFKVAGIETTQVIKRRKDVEDSRKSFIQGIGFSAKNRCIPVVKV
jgi:vacuolar-type H+-ATPase subunit F/Vma7